MTSISDATYSATQTVVTFLTQTADIGQPNALTSKLRVFDFDISSQSQATYTALMNILYNQETLNGGQTTAYLKTVSEIFSVLNTWSAQKYVDSNGLQTSAPLTQITITDPILAYALSTALNGLTYSSTHPDVIINPGTTNAQAVSLAGKPVFDTSTNVLTLDSTMNSRMAQQLDTLIRTMRAAGWDPVYSPISQSFDPFATNNPNYDADIALYQNAMKTLFVSETDLHPATQYGIYAIMQNAINTAAQASIIGDASTQSQSLQELLMVDYVVRGNEVLYNEMDSLNAAITVNQKALTYLNALQDLLNQKTPQNFLLQLQTLSSDINSDSYSTFEQQTFGNQTLGTTANFTSSDISAYLISLQMKADGADPTNALDRAKYGLDDHSAHLFAVLNYDIDNNLINTNGTLKTGALDPTDTTTQTTYRLTAMDGALFTKAIIPAIAAWNNNIAYDPANPSLTQLYNPNSCTTLKSWLADPIVQCHYSISSPADSVYNMIQAGVATYNSTTGGLDFTDEATTVWGLSPGLQAVFKYPGLQTSSTEPTFSQEYLSQLFMAHCFGTLEGYTDPTFAFNTDGTLANPLTFTYTATDGSTQIENEESNPYIQALRQVLPQGGAGIAAQLYTYNFHATSDPSTLISTNALSTLGAVYTTTTSIPDVTTTEGSAASAFVDTTSNSFNATLDQIKSNLTSLMTSIKPVADGTALYNALQVVYNDFNTTKSVAEWVADYDTIGNEGNYQRHMNNAITASQAFNDTERENLRRVMFVYEEFYKSATAMLDNLNQLLAKIASSIRG